MLFYVQLIIHVYNKVRFQQSFGCMEGLDPDFTRCLHQVPDTPQAQHRSLRHLSKCGSKLLLFFLTSQDPVEIIFVNIFSKYHKFVFLKIR